jgi:hypothetical protein
MLATMGMPDKLVEVHTLSINEKDEEKVSNLIRHLHSKLFTFSRCLLLLKATHILAAVFWQSQQEGQQMILFTC